MGRVGIWLALLMGAFFAGRGLGHREGPAETEGQSKARRRFPWRAALKGLEGGLTTWARLAPVAPARPVIGTSRSLEGRLGGEVSSPAMMRASAARPSPRSPARAAPETTARDEFPKGRLARWWAYTRELFRRFGEDQAPAFAASLSFFGILSLVPVLLIALAALGYMIQDPQEAARELQNIVQQMLPGAQAKQAAATLMRDVQLAQQAEELMRARGVAGVVGLLSLLWAALQIFVNGATSMNAAWSVEETRSWLKQRLVALGLLFGAGALFLFSLLPSSGPDAVRRLNIPWLGLPERVPWSVDLAFALLAVAINVAMFTLIYRFLPNARVTWRQALVGGVFMGVLWELAKQGFSLYLAHFGNYNKMYGSLGGLMILILWIYYTSMLLLLGAELTKLYKDIREGRLRREEAKPPVGAKREAEPKAA
jgi:membrane protein